MGFDLGYLLFLQELRNALGGAFDEVFNSLSKVAVTLLPMMPYVIFWSVDRLLGYRFLLTHAWGEIINGVIKLTVCSYRPWIRNSAIVPAGDSKVAATGYSFPSGHTMCAASVYGNTALWQYKRHRWISVVCIILLALTGFSRNFLGVHTPQDVVAALLEVLVILTIVVRLEPKIHGNEKLQDRLSLIGAVIPFLVIIYITFKPYPMDYIDGKLIVDPQRMMNDCFYACGMFFAFAIGNYIERHYVHYQVPVHDSRLPILTAVGFILIYAWNELFSKATVIPAFGGHWGKFLQAFILMMFGLVIYPMIIQKATAQPETLPTEPLLYKEREKVEVK